MGFDGGNGISWNFMGFILEMTNTAIENGHRNEVSCPINSMGDFQELCVGLLEGLDSGSV